MNVSVIIPTFNGERYLPAALHSVFAQTYPSFEVIVVDDGSTDQSKQVARAFPVHFEACEHRGPAATRNTGIALAKGDCIALLDQDDLWLPTKLELQVQALVQNPEVGVVFAGIEQFISEDTPEVASEVRFAGGVQHFPSTSTLLARRTVFDQVGDFPLLQSADSMLWLARVQASGIQVQILEACLAKRRIHHSNMTRVLRGKVHSDYFKALHLHLQSKRQGNT